MNTRECEARRQQRQKQKRIEFKWSCYCTDNILLAFISEDHSDSDARALNVRSARHRAQSADSAETEGDQGLFFSLFFLFQFFSNILSMLKIDFVIAKMPLVTFFDFKVFLAAVVATNILFVIHS